MKEEFSTVADSVQAAPSSSRSTSQPTTTSGLAKRSKTSSKRNKSGSNQSTLSMISTPWCTESSFTTTPSHGKQSLRWRAFTGSTYTATSLEPHSSSTNGGSSSNGLSAFLSTESSETCTDHGGPERVKFMHIEVPKGQRSPFSSNSLTSSWTLEGFTSTEFSDRVNAKYPWSPATSDQIDMSLDYPSSFTLVSQKSSWDTMSGRYAFKDYTPMNHFHYSGDIHPNHDWMLVKVKGITESGEKC